MLALYGCQKPMVKSNTQTSSTQWNAITLNTYCTLNGVLDDRTKRSISALTKVDLVGLQEVVVTQQKKQLAQSLKGHQFVFSNHTQVEYPMASYVPSASILTLGFLIIGLSTGLLKIGLIDQATFWGLLTPGFLCTLIGIAIHPHMLIKLLGCCAETPHQMAHQKADHMGLALAVNSSEFSNLKVIYSQPFNHLGYTFPSPISCTPYQCHLALFARTFIQISYCRPGVLIAHTETKKDRKKIYLANAHLATGMNNDKRLLQVKELSQLLKSKIPSNCPMFLFMDANESPDGKANQYLKSLGLKDVWHEIHGSTKRGYIWNNKNKLIQEHSTIQEPDQRIDYIFYKEGEKSTIDLQTAELIGVEFPFSDHYGIQATILHRTNLKE